CGADGVELGEDGLPIEAARRIAEGLLLGRSVHSVDGALKAQADGADILVVGTIFPTGSHPGVETAGVSLLEQMRGQVEIPYLAIGGVTAENVESVIEAGAVGAAVITAISKSPNPEQASRELLQRMRASSQKGRKSMIALTVNGKEKQLDSPTNLLTYVESLGVNIQHIAVAYNGSVIRRDELTSVTLSEGDQVEIVRAVGGG
ncbi:MAG: sulfur carrier protein ThiS, partial [Chloroflexi bacterium]|nr:sulfur carrier protein ThiS [Chloroflexota bacterium]